MKTGSSICSREKAQTAIISKCFRVNGLPVLGLSFQLGAKPLVLLKARYGFIMCGYLNLKAAQKFNDAACVVKKVSNIGQLLNAPIVDLTKAAKAAGVKKGMRARQALYFLS